MKKSLSRIGGIILLVLACPVARAVVGPTTTSFEMDGDYGSVIETNGNISDDGHQTTYSHEGSGQYWTHTGSIIPYMGSNCYKVVCTNTPAGAVKDRSEQRILSAWGTNDTRFFRMAVYIPSTTVTTNWLMLSQWWQNASNPPPLSLGYQTNGSLELVRRYQGDSYQCLTNIGGLEKNQWHHFLMKVKFGIESNGALGLWKMNLAEGKWETRYTNDALTLGWTYMGTDTNTLADYEFTWKVGTYRGAQQLKTEVYYDNIHYGKYWTSVTKEYYVGYKCTNLDLQFNETSGTNANDSSAYDNDGQLVGGPVWTTGGVSNTGCLKFDGSNDCVRVPVDPAYFDFGNYMTASAWFRSTNAQTGKAIVCMDEYSTTYKFRLYLVNSTGLQFAVRHTDNTLGVAENKALGSSVLDGQWHHVAGTYNRWASDGKRLKIYLDGVLIGESAGADKPLWSGDNYLYIGRFSSTYFKGYVDDVGLYNYPMDFGE